MRMIGNERKQEKKVYLKKKNIPLRWSTLFHYTVKKKSFKVQRCDDFLWWYPVWRKSMHSFEDERCYTVARLASKLESGCRQLLHKLKSCEATQRKCASYEMYIAKKLADGQNLLSSSVVLLLKKGAELSEDPLTICDASWGASEDRLSLWKMRSQKVVGPPQPKWTLLNY